jgi:hypothetical protein
MKYFKKKEPGKVKDDLIGHNQPPGANVPEYDSKIADDYFDNMPIGAIMKKRIKETGEFSGTELRHGAVFPTLTGPQKEKLARMLLDGQEYLRYKDIRVACRITIPLMDVRMIKSASKHLRDLAKELSAISKDTNKSKFERVLMAQNAVVETNGNIKWKHGLFEMLGVHSLR